MATGNFACSQCKSTTEPTSTCIQCNNLSFCDGCWPKWILHGRGSVGYDGKPHEKSNPHVVQQVRGILEPQNAERTLEEQLQQDEHTTWFGIERHQPEQVTLEDYGRFATLMSESKFEGENDGDRFPQLVSFIGQCGAGKSTIIKLLVEHGATGETFPSPVPASSDNDRIPTTGDVHLYADPTSYRSHAPMLYADSEGLDGGETTPRGLRHKLVAEAVTIASKVSKVPHPSTLKRGGSSIPGVPEINVIPQIMKRNKLKKNRHSSTREIAWVANQEKQGKQEKQMREYAVLKLYPRLLYTFSDVVVFVLRNARAFESTVLAKLVEWGHSSIDKSVNSPTLPHVVIVINATDNNLDDREWDVTEATRLFLHDIREAVNNPRLDEYVQHWRPYRDVKSTEELLMCYYASINVVRIPSPPKYMLIGTQVRKLYSVIRKHCFESHRNKKRARMLATADKLQIYLRAAYDHFSQNLDEPFDFVKEALKHSPISRDFGGSILKLALSLKERWSQIGGTTQKIFDYLSRMVAHCIFLSSVRQSLMGDPTTLLDGAYAQFCKDALQTYLDLYAPCNYEHPKHGRCCNLKSTHTAKGHQNSQGKYIGKGAHVSDLNDPEYEASWFRQIRVHLIESQAAFNRCSIGTPESQRAASTHTEFVNGFYGGLGAKTTWWTDFIIPMPPKFTGLRVLCLDGGGVRGIAELQVLKAIEQELGTSLRIQNFFDLIVGTSTGGIIALGLGVRKWSVDECINHFKRLSKEAFQGRELNGVPVLRTFAALNHGSMYKTRPFKNVLQNMFGSSPLFGDMDHDMVAPVRVAVTTTTSVDQHPVVLANYNRSDPSDYVLPYEFHRPDLTSQEFKVWEAARATSAAPPYFKVFTKEDTSATYVDGAFYHNNPVRVAHHEQRLISNEKLPDFLLSIGTGRNADVEKYIAKPTTHDVNQKEVMLSGRLKVFYRMMTDRLEHILECDRIWKSFVAEISPDLRQRVHRLDPDLRSTVPRLDAVDKIDSIEEATRKAMDRKAPGAKEIKEIAHRLVASTFFFEKTLVKSGDGGFQCAGHLRCRFGDSPDQLKGFGYYLLRCVQGDFKPYFVVQDDDNDPEIYPLSLEVLNDMELRGVFQFPKMSIRLSRDTSMAHISIVLQPQAYFLSETTQIPISGFPRMLVSEDNEMKVTSPKLRPPEKLEAIRKSSESIRSVEKPSNMKRTSSLSLSNLRLFSSRSQQRFGSSTPQDGESVSPASNRHESVGGETSSVDIDEAEPEG